MVAQLIATCPHCPPSRSWSLSLTTQMSPPSVSSKQPPPTLTKPKKVMLSAPPPKSELSNGLTPPLSDHGYWSDQTSSIREEEESPASATSLEVTPSPRPESKIDARSCLLRARGGEEDGEQQILPGVGTGLHCQG